MATLYRCSTPTDWLCPCGTVARALRREGIAYETRSSAQRRSQRAEVEALSGQTRVPLLVIDGEVICDSRRIREHLEFRPRHARPARARRRPAHGGPARALTACWSGGAHAALGDQRDDQRAPA